MKILTKESTIWLGLAVFWFLFITYEFFAPEPPIIPRKAWIIPVIITFTLGLYGYWLYRKHLKLEKAKIRKLTPAEKILGKLTVLFGFFLMCYVYAIEPIIARWYSKAWIIIIVVIPSVLALLWTFVYFRAKRKGEL